MEMNNRKTTTGLTSTDVEKNRGSLEAKPRIVQVKTKSSFN
jgi:hypothetical protein